VWAIVAILAATVVLSVATTLVTLALKHFRPARRTLTAATGPQASTDTPSVTAEPEAGDGEILTSHDYLAERDIHPADSR
jgi:hypothetical protein